MNSRDRRRMVDAVAKALRAEAEHRPEHDDWIERERMAVAAEVNRWATSRDWPTITVADVERVEPRAIGHIDYVTKLSLYCSELVWP